MVPLEEAAASAFAQSGFGVALCIALQCKVAGATGLEPATSGVTGRRSNQLSYAPA